ncbi:MAG: phage antirepressor N-terminal domain-containing protein [Bacteroidales bacterium]|nr:phage antirepressor N-terminal domain-containing protein [Bacteroidales bacterium]
MNKQLVTVDFYGDTLEAVQSPDGKVWVSLRRCCENLGIDPKTQFRKLRSKSWACVVEITTHDSTGRQQPAAVLSLDTVPMWLATIDPRRVKESVRDKLIRYQKECAKVLADHFFGQQQASQQVRQWWLSERIWAKNARWLSDRQQLAVARYACAVIFMRFGELPLRNGPGVHGLIFLPHQLEAVDEAIDRLFEEGRKSVEGSCERWQSSGK